MTEQNIEKKLFFIKEHCGPLSSRQQNLTIWHIRHDQFYGVARPAGRAIYFPLVSRDGTRFEIIDKAGFYQDASPDRKGYTATEDLND